MASVKVPGVGAGVFVLHEDKLLIGRRKNVTGEGR
jgi:hypothetical protein